MRFRGWHWAALAWVVHGSPVAAASLEGEALYRERIMPPAGAVLVVSLEDTARADARATELAGTRMKLAGGPPYRWRLEYDERLVDSISRPVLRAWIETSGGLWMTTDTVVPASTVSPVLELRSVRRAPDPCADASTQLALNECAYQGFLDASAAMSRQLGMIESALQPAQRTAWRRAQKAWLTYRTEACQFESAGAAGGSAKPMVLWQCSARITKERSIELAKLATCSEGDIACAIAPQQGKTP